MTYLSSGIFITHIFSSNPLLRTASNEGCCSVINVDLQRFINVNAIQLNVQKVRWRAFRLELPLSGASILSLSSRIKYFEQLLSDESV
jgi:hypothetical protein